ncbi:MAG: zinc-dependent peptidase [Verrucomicrobiae bacterium]|nr:zinc-dependent peptidase [Verrucomicrobiae bacterium]
MPAPGWIEWTELAATLAVFIPVAILIRRRICSRRARERRLRTSFQAAETTVLDRDFPRWRDIPEELTARFSGITRVLIEEKNYEPCGGLEEVTEEMKLLIAAQAALTILGRRKQRFFPRLHSILVYPGAFRDPGRRSFGIDDEARGVLYGESWETGSVVLSWDNVIAGARNGDDGMNVVIHEFAHQLDQDNGAADGVPELETRDDYRRWSEVMERHYEELVTAAKDPAQEPFLDPYGATHPCEFFAVASEAFFEDSLDLEYEHPLLYEELSKFYGLDPAAWPFAS